MFGLGYLCGEKSKVYYDIRRWFYNDQGIESQLDLEKKWPDICMCWNEMLRL